MNKYLDFEKPIAELESKIEELRHLSSTDSISIADEISRLQAKATKMLIQTYGNLTPWQKVQVARHQDRPKFNDYIAHIVHDFIPLAGDRCFGEDMAIIGGLGRIGPHRIMVLGQEKGADTASRVKHNFGMPRPEGYRKAQRLMLMADRFKLPIVTFVDTAGAYAGIDAEERGQAQAIARSIEICLKVKVPIISVIIGEGGSGGAIAIAAANYLMMLEHSIYSVISPEGCASILWRSAAKAPEAAQALRLTAQDLLSLGVIDEILPEPVGGAHRYKTQILEQVKLTLIKALEKFSSLSQEAILKDRRNKFLEMGAQTL